MKEDGSVIATRFVDPILLKYRLLLVKKYGGGVLSGRRWDTRYSEVELYVQIEGLRDALARNKISRWEFAEKLLILTELRHDLSPDVQQIVRELYETLVGGGLPASIAGDTRIEAVQLHTRSGVKEVLGECPLCATLGDLSYKALVKCKYCGKLYCEKHSRPKLAMTFNQYQAYLAQCRDIAHIIEEHWVSENGHPCSTYTNLFWREYHKRKAKQRGVWEQDRRVKGEVEPARFGQVRTREQKRKGLKKLLIFFIFVLLLAFLNADLDGDRLPMLMEVSRGLDPFSKDTDSDGLSDSTELELGTNPLLSDSDRDGLTDEHELKLGTSPLSKDSDGDELGDPDELMLGTNPLVSDSDEDGLNDGFEARLGTSPLATDTDGDELSDAEELLRVGTDPLLSDSDGDGLSDGYEYRIGTNPLRNWRWFFDGDTIKSALCEQLRAGVAHLAQKLTGVSLGETVWNVLKWVDENIEYDYEKARREKRDVYSPTETVLWGKGICADYALLTAALLLESGAREVYILVLSRISDPSSGHAAVAVVVNGKTYILDQRLPPLRYEEYLSVLKLDWKISQVYKVNLNPAGEPQVEVVTPDRLPAGRSLSTAEISNIVYRVLLRFNPNLQWDTRLASTALDALIAEQSSKLGSSTLVHLPPGYREGVLQRLRMHPATISEDFAENWFNELLSKDETRSVIIKYRRVYIAVEIYTLLEWKDTIIIIVLANQ